MTRVAVIGAGAMGGLFGARLAEAGAEVAMIDVDPATLDAIRRDGLPLQDDAGDRRVRVAADTADRVTGPCDLLLVFTKGPHTAAAVASVRHLAGPEAWTVTVQNGLGNDALIAAALAAEQLAYGMTNWPADLAAPGFVRSHGSGEMRLWHRGSGDAGGLERIAALFGRAGLNCIVDPRVDVPVWEKVIFNAAMNSIAAVSGARVGMMADSADARALIAAITREAGAVAAAAGVAVSSERIEASIAHGLAHHRAHKPSMLQDIEAGRATEAGSILDPILARGEAHGVATPTLWTMARLIRLIEHRNAAGRAD